MLWFKRIFGFALVIILALATIIFVLENQTASAISFLGFNTPELPVSLFIVSVFVIGGLLGLTLGLIRCSRLKYRLKATESRLARNSKELRRLQQIQETPAPTPIPQS